MVPVYSVRDASLLIDTVYMNSTLHKRKMHRMDGRLSGCYNVTFAEQKRAASPHGC